MSSLGEILYLSRHAIENLNIPITEVIRVVEKALLEKAKRRTEVPPKPGIHPQKDAFIHAMPAYIPRMKPAGMKWVSGFPENPKHGLPYISGLLILNKLASALSKENRCWNKASVVGHMDIAKGFRTFLV